MGMKTSVFVCLLKLCHQANLQDNGGWIKSGDIKG